MKKLALILTLCLSLHAFGAGKGVVSDGETLSELLRQCLELEEIHPDSVESDLRMLEARRLSLNNPAGRAVYAAAIARLYFVNGELEQSKQRFADALADMPLLAESKTSQWVPLVIRGNMEKVFGGDMLHVVWYAMTETFYGQERQSLPSYREIIDCYRKRGNRTAMLQLMLDSVEMTQSSKDQLLRLKDEYADQPLCAEVYHRLSQLTDSELERRDLLQEAITRFPDYWARKDLQNELTQMSDPTFHWDGPTFAYPGKQYKWKFRVRNIQSVTIDGKVHSFGKHEAVEEIVDSMMWTAPSKPGIYKITFVPATATRTTSKIRPITQKIQVSALQMIHQKENDKQVRIIALDSESGRPQKGVTMVVYEQTYPKDTVEWKRFVTDDRGQVTVPWDTQTGNSNKRNRNLPVRMLTSEEKDLPIMQLYSSYYYKGAATDSTLNIRMYTDRAIYRPGQEVHIGGVVYNTLEWDAQVVAGRQFDIILNDASYHALDTCHVVTDDMGVFSATFTLPQKTKLGYFHAQCKGDRWQSVSFRVEEYKRPAFEVRIDDLKTPLQKQDTLVTITGSAQNYDGTPVRNARVTGNYSIRAAWVMRKYVPAETFALDTIYTDSKGCFSYTLPVHIDEADREWTRLMEMKVDVLSALGESHHDEKTLRIIEGKTHEPQKADSTLWLRCDCDTFAIGRPAYVTIGSDKENAWLLCSVSSKDGLALDTIMCMSRDSFTFEIPYREEYEQGVTFNVCMVQGEKFYSKTQDIYLQQPDKKLRVHWSTFRDKVRPGDKEEWRLTLTNPDGTPASASLMATIYDASLEQFASHHFILENALRNHVPCSPFLPKGPFPCSNDTWRYYSQKLQRTTAYNYSRFDESYFTPLRRRFNRAVPLLMAKGVGTTLREVEVASLSEDRAVVNYAMAETTALKGKISGLSSDAVEDAEETVVEEENGLAAVAVRENFSELAYFVPSLRTDENGTVSLAFTLPDCVTTWRLLATAHTSDMLLANLMREAVASKELMAVLSLPRFVRQGDVAELSATIKNVSDARQKGSAMLLVTDAATGKDLKKWRCKFDVSAASDSVYHFMLPVTMGMKDVVVKWVAENKLCSDGEQRALPVLSSLEHVTNTRALWLNGEGLTEENLEGMFPEGSTERQFTVQYTTHPEQLALQCLPELAVTKSECVLSLAAAYYAGRLAMHLDVNVQDSTETYLRKIKTMQTEEGALTWYPGMPASPYITREVAFLLTRLQQMTGNSERDLLDDMVRYLGQENSKMIKEWKKEQFRPKELPIGLMRNLYILVYNKVLLTKEQKKDVDYLVNLLMNTKLDFEESALAAIILQQARELNGAKKMLHESTRLLVKTPEQGTYIEHPKGPFTSIDRKLAIHVQIMEAVQKVQPDNKLLAGMKRWLLQQKRTQQWDTHINTANAVYALMNGVERRNDAALRDVLTLTKRGTKVPVNFTAKDDTLGYICDTIAVDGNLPQTLRIHKLSDGDSWGAVYANFCQPYRDVESASTGLKVSVVYPEGIVVGQKVTVVVTIDADRDYEYVDLSVPKVAAMEATDAVSGYRWQKGLSYYREVRDASQELHFYSIPRGKYKIELPYYVERQGTYNTGVATIQCSLAPEFSARSNSQEIRIR